MGAPLFTDPYERFLAKEPRAYEDGIKPASLTTGRESALLIGVFIIGLFLFQTRGLRVRQTT